MRSDATAAAVGICYYHWKFGDEVDYCKSISVRPCNWQEIDTWWHVNAVARDLVHIVNQCLAGVFPAQVAIFWVDLMCSLQAV
jgi:hypothetical protein